MKLDDWQAQVLQTKGNLCLRSGRQVGKSTIISIKAGEFAVNNRNKTILVIASVERQSYLLFEKILDYLVTNYKSMIKTGKWRPTKHVVRLKNGSVIHCLPTGLTGYGIRGYTIDLLIADEAAFIPEEVWTAVTPMLAVTKGDIWLLSTPHGKEGYFYRAFSDPAFTTFHVSSEDCPRRDDEFLKKERERMTKVQYAQEYLGEFVDELLQFFPSSLIKECMSVDKGAGYLHGRDKFLGVDVARMGTDQSVMISVDRHGDRLRMFDMLITEKSHLTETIRLILDKDKIWNYRKIYIDDGGMGVGVFDPLLEHNQTKRKVVAINNARRSLDRDESRKKKLMKEDLYNNLLRLMEQHKIELFDDPEIYLSLKSVQYEYTDDGSLKIFGNYTHIVEALIRAAWCVKDKTLNIWIR